MANIKLKSGHSVEPFSDEDNEKHKKLFTAYDRGLVRLNPTGWVFPPYFHEQFADKLYDFEYRPTDIVIMTYPKCGTTWTQEIIWNMVNNPDLDNPKAKMPLFMRTPFLDFDFLLCPPSFELFRNEVASKMAPGALEEGSSIFSTKHLIPDPRVIKCHLPFSLLHPKLLDTCKVIYVARHPKDVLMSYYHHSRLLSDHGFVGSFEEFLELYMKDEAVYSPIFDHYFEAWKLRGHKNLHYIFYEDMKANPTKALEKFNTFLDLKLTEKQVENMVDYTSFTKMKARETEIHGGAFDTIMNLEIKEKEGGFFRKGESKSWKGKLTEDQEKQLNDWITKSTEGTDLKF